MTAYGPIGFYVDCDMALCPDHFTEPAEPFVTGEITRDDPLAIFPDTESDTPTHCAECEALIPHALTPEGYEYVSEAVAQYRDFGIGRGEIVEQWAAQYEDGISY
jgi:hypothetical protein